MALPEAFGPDVTVFRRLGRTPDERAWLRALPDCVRRLEDAWGVTTGRPYAGGSSSWAAPGDLIDGTPVVLKIAWPHREARGEGIGLRLWDGRGAPLLHAAESESYAVLMERCEPGIPLAETALSRADALLAAATVLRDLWVQAPPDHGLETVDAVCTEWASTVRDRQDRLRAPFDPALVALGADLLESLPGSAVRDVVVHGDANPTNVLAATRRPWLLIDGKPMVGDPAYDLAPLAVQLGSPLHDRHPARALRDSFILLADALDLPVARMIAWAVARGVESALWYASTGDDAAGVEEMACVDTLAHLLG